MKRSSKIGLGIFGGLILLILIWWVGYAAISGWNSYKWQQKTDAFQAKLEQPYKDDTYGGKTPEETWAMYISALEKKDFELASKYYALSDQNKAFNQIKGVADSGNLSVWINELRTLEKDNVQADKERPQYWYKYYYEEFKKNFSSPVSFYQNPYTKVWKIIY